MNNESPATPPTAARPGVSWLLSSVRAFESLKPRIDALVRLVRLKHLARGCALPAEVLTLIPGSSEVVFGSMQEVAAKAERFAQAVSREREDFESHYRDNRKLLVADAWSIAHVTDVNEERVAYEFACACLRANRSKTAHAIFDDLAQGENRTSKYAMSAKRRTARMAWKAGDIETAVRILRTVRGRAARTQYRTWLGISTVRNGVLIGESGDLESARAVLMGGLLATGMDPGLAQGVTAIYLNAVSREPLDASCLTIPPSVSRKNFVSGGPTPVVLSGFGWSGSGAVADFLKGHPRVDDVFSSREIGLWTGRFGLDRLYAHFVSRGFNRRLLLEFLTRHSFGHSFLADSRGTKSHGGVWSWLDESQRWLFLEALSKWLEALQKWQRDPRTPVLESFRNLSSALLQLLAREDASCVLLSNCIPSDAIAGIRMFEGPVVIVSWRDPGDAYASKTAAFPDSALEFSGWEKQLTARIDSYLAAKREVAACAQLWMDLSFEEFVEREELRQRLLHFLDLHDQPMRSTFDPSASARNIGILKTVSRQRKSEWSALASSVSLAREEAQSISEESIGKCARTSSDCTS